MVQFGVPTVEAAMKLGREAADYISGTFIKVICENLAVGYIWKKNYVGNNIIYDVFPIATFITMMNERRLNLSLIT